MHIKFNTIHQAFENVASHHPHKIAVYDGKKTTTYAELNQRANQVAKDLQRSYKEIKGHCIKKDTLIAVCMNRSTELLVAILGILKAGAAYVPLDTSNPPKRLQSIVNDCKPNFIIALTKDQESLFKNGNVVLFEDFDINNSNKNLNSKVKMSDLAYVIYTSGSTGKPKGVMIEHRNVLNYINWFHDYTKCNLGQRIDFSSNISFDISVTSTLTALVLGYSIYICSEDIKRDSKKYLQFIGKNKINIIKVTPSYLRVLAEEIYLENIDLSNLKKIIVGGENLQTEVCKKWLSIYPEHHIHNEYGPTETTVGITQFKVTKENINKLSNFVPIGTAKQNHSYLIINTKNEGLGELYITGAGVARGYLNNPILTEKYFKLLNKNIYYKSGDIVEELDDQTLNFVGRKDRQIKLRGHRIELNEIERVLLKHSAILTCAVVLRKHNKNSFLVMFYVLKKDKEIKKNLLTNYLKKHFPEYMMPSSLINLGEMPLNSNNKIDYEKLTSMDLASSHNSANKNKLTKVITSIWSEELGHTIEGNANFFEVGGDSLSALRILQEIQKQLKVVIDPVELYEHPSLDKFIKFVEKSVVKNNSSVHQTITNSSSVNLSLTFPQKRMWFVCQHENNTAAYNVPLLFKLKGELDIKKLNAAFNTIIKKHDILQSIFISDKYEPKRFIKKKRIVILQNVYNKDNLKFQLRQIVNTPLNLEKEIIKVHLLKNKKEYVLIILLHHIVCDQITINLFLKELSQIYNGLKLESKINKYNISDYAIWEKELFDSKLDAEKNYWLKTVSNFNFANSIIEPIPKIAKEIIKKHTTKIDKLKYLELKTFANQHNLTFHNLLIGLLSIFISRYFNKEEIIFLIPVSSRENEKSKNLFGFFLNLLPIITPVKENLTVLEHVSNTNKLIADVIKHRFISYEEVKKLFPVDINIALDALVTFQDKTKEMLSLDNLTTTRFSAPIDYGKFPLNIHFLNFSNHLEIEIEHNEDITHINFNEVIINFKNFLHKAIPYADKKISQLRALSIQQVVKIKNITKGPSENTSYQNISSWMIKSFNCNAQNIGLCIGETKYTFQQIEENVRRVSNWLINQNIKGRVIISMDKSAKSIFNFLGTILAGCTYVPITSEIPKFRVDLIIDDLKPSLFIDDSCEINSSANVELNLNKLVNDDLYIIYTSGSTGFPKGVRQKHLTMINLIEHMSKNIKRSARRVLQLSSFNFDVSIQEILFSILTGRTLYIPDADIRSDPEKLNTYILKNKINLTIFTPSYFSEIVKASRNDKKHYPDMEVVYLSGEKLILSDHMKIFMKSNNHIDFYNQYGPSESHVVTEYKITNITDDVPIGKPIRNIRTYIVNAQLDILPIGIQGDLYIAGHGVCNGYVNNHDNQFLESKLNERIIYKTGDRARLLSDGNIQFLSRSDRQVKLRGVRIELQEVELAILSLQNILRCAVIIKEDKIIAFYNSKDNQEISSQTLRSHLLYRLPSYMVPNLFISISEFPTTISGKIDYQRLGTYLISPKETSIANTDKFSDLIINIWRSKLKCEAQLNDDFFAIGGHSIIAASVISEINEYFNLQLPVSTLFEKPKLNEFIHHIKYKCSSNNEAIKLLSTSCYPLSYLQKRMWSAINYGNANGSYNIPVVFDIKGRINHERLNDSMNVLANKHKILRARFSYDDEGNVKQYFHDLHTKQNKVINLYCPINDFESQISTIVNVHFNLEQDILFKVYLLKSDEKSALIIIFHHLICDGRSVELLLNEITNIYNHDEISISNKEEDFYDHISKLASLDNINKSNSIYWQNKISNFTALDLNKNLILPSNEVNKYGMHSHSINISHLKLQDTSHLFSLLLTAFSIVAYKIVNQAKFDLLTIVDATLFLENREIIGPLLNLAIISIDIENSQKVEDLVHTIRNEIFTSIKKSNHEIENLLQRIEIEKLQQIFSLAIIYHHYKQNENFCFGDAKLLRRQTFSSALKNPFSINVYPQTDKINLIIEFDQSRFDFLFISNFSKTIDFVFNIIIENQGTIISKMPLMSRCDTNKLVLTYNNTITSYPKNKSLYELFSSSSKNRAAVIYKEKIITYAQLTRRINIISKAITTILDNIPINLETRIAILLDRTPDSIAAMLALVHLGITYVPIDIRYSDCKIKKMISETDSILIITDQTQSDRFSMFKELNIPILDLDNFNYNLNIQLTPQVNKVVTILHTSGSTSTPKYVPILNKSIVRLFKNTNYLSVKKSDVIASLASYTFDVSLLEIFGSLTNNASLLLVPYEYIFDSAILENYLISNKVTIVFISSKLFCHYAFIKPSIFSQLKSLYIGGDKLDLSAINKIKSAYKDLEIFNLYGSTENTTNTTFFNLRDLPSKAHNIPIGKPVSNTQVYVLNHEKNLVPEGIPGDLYCSGDGLALGYLHQADTNSIIYLKNLQGKKAIRTLQTGDVVRWLPKGDLEFLGRLDRVVKINNVKLDLRSIEACLNCIDKVDDNFVDYIEPLGLIIYYVGSATRNNIMKILSQKFPHYHIPRLIIPVKIIFLNTHGKVDRYKLKREYIDNLKHSSCNNLTNGVIEVIAQTTGHNSFDENSSIMDIVDSLTFMKLCVNLEKKYNLKINPTTLFNLPTIQAISNHIENLSSRSQTVSKKKPARSEEDQVAIIGMKLRTPGAKDISDFWEKILNGNELIHEENFKDTNGLIYGFLNDYKLFSPEKFDFNLREAQLIDPQHRILLEMASDLLEDQNIKNLVEPSKTGVFVSCGFNFYLPSTIYKNFDNLSDHEKNRALVSNEKDSLATLISYKLNLKGPALNINTACSSSLVSIIKACESILSGESDCAIAGGISLIYPESMEFMSSQSELYSKSNHCSPFSKNSDGVLRSSGAGLILLKRLKDAINDGDEIVSIISGYSINNDGSNKQTYFAPSLDSQAENMKNCLDHADISPNDIFYIESHGTGTALGDAVELAALNQVFNINKNNSITLGSVKANIGHTDTASGVIGIIKAALILKNKVIPPQINFDEPNHLLREHFSPFVIEKTAKQLVADSTQSICISSLGIGGTNSHAILRGSDFTPITKLQSRQSKSKNYPKKICWLSEPREILTNNHSNDIKQELASIWNLCFDITSENHFLSFLDANADSVKLAELNSMIAERFGIELSMTELLKHDTITKQSTLIRQKRKLLSNKFLIKLNNQTQGKKLILIHPVGGGVFCYAKFAKLLEEFMPVYAIQNSFLAENSKSFESISEMAKFYNEMLSDIIDTNEFILAGWSFGGNVAYEMANQLKEKYLSPEIIFFDSWNFSHLEFPHDEMMKESIRDYMPEVLDLAAGYDLRNQNKFYDFINDRMQLILKHNYFNFHKNIILFKSTDLASQFNSINCKYNHWNKIIETENLNVIHIQGNHYNIFNAENVKTLTNTFLNTLGFI